MGAYCANRLPIARHAAGHHRGTAAARIHPRFSSRRTWSRRRRQRTALPPDEVAYEFKSEWNGLVPDLLLWCRSCCYSELNLYATSAGVRAVPWPSSSCLCNLAVGAEREGHWSRCGVAVTEEEALLSLSESSPPPPLLRFYFHCPTTAAAAAKSISGTHNIMPRFAAC